MSKNGTPVTDRIIASEPKPKPSPFTLKHDGVYVRLSEEGEDPVRLCGHLEVAAVTRDASGENHGRHLRWKDCDGHIHEWVMPMALVARDEKAIFDRLMGGGLYVIPKPKARPLLLAYIQSTVPGRARTATKTGWNGDVFVMPGGAIGAKTSEPVVFQDSGGETLLNVRGTVAEWRDGIGRVCANNSRLAMAVSIAFAGPLLELLGEENGGIHIVAKTSIGKTTAALVGGSVLGGGGATGFCRSWHATANGFESVAESHNDLTLFLEEIGQANPHEVGEIAYLLANGAGKARMSRNVTLRRGLTWRLPFLSTGEKTLADHAESVGKTLKGGVGVRVLNIPADAGAGMGLFEDIHGAVSPEHFSRQLKEATGKYYGVAIREFLTQLTAELALDREACIQRIKAKIQYFVTRYVPDGAIGEVHRAARRLAVIYAAGSCATGYGITGWSEYEAEWATAACLKAWLDQRDGGSKTGSDEENGVRQVRAFFEQHGASRFQSTKTKNGYGKEIAEKIVNRVGFRDSEDDGEVTVYYILPEMFRREVAKGFNYETVLRALQKRGFLEHDSGRLTKQKRLPELGKTNTYAVKAEILEGGAE